MHVTNKLSVKKKSMESVMFISNEIDSVNFFKF